MALDAPPDRSLELLMPTSIACSDLSFAWPDGKAIFSGLSFIVGPGRTGLVGLNGSGKSTLLRLIAGELTPDRGSVRVSGELGYLPQNLVLEADLPVDELLGIARVRRAVRAIERGHADEENLAIVGDRWDVAEQAMAVLGQVGLGHIGLDRRVGQLSGGEVVLMGLAAQIVRRPDVLLLDEPTNNLDLGARRRLSDVVASWTGMMVMVSHDRALLQLADQIADLRAGEIRWYGGNLAAYEDAVAGEQQAAERRVRAAESDLRRQQRELSEARIKLDRRQRFGRKMWASKREPKAVMGERKRQAQVSAGKHRIMQAGKVTAARDRLAGAAEAIRDDAEIRLDLRATAVPGGRSVITLADAELRFGGRVTLDVRGPERIALAGANGAGKTTLLRTVAGSLGPASGLVRLNVPARYLPQRLDLLDDQLTVAQNVARFAPQASGNEIRARLARFLFRGAAADRPAGTLSGGERFRASLAALLLAEPPPQLLLLDEPTNNLDMPSASQLGRALRTYPGALIVASHDLPFLRDIGVTRWVRLDRGLTEIDPL
jgi:ATPase subunit of ABC transporter with duplicated ATPase domains